MKRMIAILLVVLALGLVFGCAQKHAETAPIKSTPNEEVAAEPGIEELPEEEMMPPEEAPELPEPEPVAAPDEEPEPAPEAEVTVSQEDLDALNAEIEGMEFEDLTGLSE
jgi:cell division protein FtsN